MSNEVTILPPDPIVIYTPVTVLLSRVMRDVQAVSKSSRNTQQGFNFRGIDAVMSAVGPALREHGVVCIPKVLSSRYREFQTSKGTTMHECLLEVEYRFIGPGGDELVGSALGESSDAGDKATPKAMSVAYRSFLLQALCIPTDEPDPDETVVERAPQAPPDPARAAKRTLLVEVKSKRPDLDDDAAKDLAGDVWTAHADDPKRLSEMLAAIPPAALREEEDQ